MYGVIVKSPIGLQIPVLKPRDWFTVCAILTLTILLEIYQQFNPQKT